MRKTAREEFDSRIMSLFDPKNPDSQSLFVYLKRLLHQFRLSRTYEVKDILVESYTRGVKLAEAEITIENPAAWLRRTAFNIIRERRRELDKFEAWDVTTEPYLEETDALSEELRREDLQTLFIAFERLESEERHILHLRVVEKMSWREIGQHLSLTEEVVHKENVLRQRGLRALEKLRKIYKEEREILRSWH